MIVSEALTYTFFVVVDVLVVQGIVAMLLLVVIRSVNIFLT